MADDGMFAPLPGAERAPKRAAPKDPWRPILPIPGDAPPPAVRHPRHGTPSRCWTYRDAAGNLLGHVWRFDIPGGGKEFTPLTFCENAATRARAWRFRAWLVPRPLYGLDRLAARPTAPVLICEGEKAADAAAELLPDHVVVASPNGAQSAGKADWRALLGRDVTLWPDNDVEGRAYAAVVARALRGIATTVKVMSPLGVPEKWDAADALAEGRDAAKAAALIAAALPADGGDTPRDLASDDAEIARLAKLPPLQYERERDPVAKRLGCRAAILDRLVSAARGNGATPGQGRPLYLLEPEPWPEPVDGAALLYELSAAVRRHVVLGSAEADAVALWAITVHAFGAFPIFPRLFATAPEKQCGKTTLLDALSRLVPKSLGASSITAAALFRTIEAARPTLLLDEADTFVRDNEDLRGVIDAGHRRDGAVIRTVGEDHEPRQFSAWAPVALAAIGHLSSTIEDRSVVINLRRRRPDEPVEPLRLDRAGHLDKLARMAARWAADHAAKLAAADPPMPAGIYNRAADNWRPLLAAADLAGGAWPNRARRAATELTAEGDDQRSIRVALLADIRAAFAAKRVDRLSSDEVASYLAECEDRRWPEYRNGKPISKTQVAGLLRPLYISPSTIRLPDDRTAKGYYRHAFGDAFARYLPPENVTTSQLKDSCRFEAYPKTSRGNDCDVCKLPETPRVPAACDGVTASEAPPDDDDFQERAGIIEFDGGYSRAEAERRARAEAGSRRERRCLQ